MKPISEDSTLCISPCAKLTACSLRLPSYKEMGQTARQDVRTEPQLVDRTLDNLSTLSGRDLFGKSGSTTFSERNTGYSVPVRAT